MLYLNGEQETEMQRKSINARDAALHRLSRVNRWLIAGSVALTGVFAEVAAHAFPGRTLASTAGGARKGSAKAGTSTTPVRPPSQAPSQESTPTPQAPTPTPEPSPSQEGAPSQESAPSQEAPPSQESAPTQESSPSQPSAPAQETAPTPAPTQESAPPVVSGGS